MSGKTENFFMVWLDRAMIGLFEGIRDRARRRSFVTYSGGAGDGEGAAVTGVIVTFSMRSRRAFCTFA
jgi:hypothetical protein